MDKKLIWPVLMSGAVASAALLARDPHPKRGSLSWYARAPLMLYRDLRNTRLSRRCSYAQLGEDLISRNLLAGIGIPRPTYLDVGANDPVTLSNTYAMYKDGCRGVLLEPNPLLFPRLRRVRRHDVCLQAGLSDHSDPAARFYRMSEPVLGTFSREEAASFEQQGYQIVEEIAAPLLTPTEVIENHLGGRCPDFVSLDTEGLDLAILAAWPFDTHRPAVFCIETLICTNGDQVQWRKQAIVQLMEKLGYRLHADTYINSIFVSKER